VLRSTAEVGLQRTRSPEEYARMLATIRDESARLGHLVDGLLLLASADDRRLHIRRDRVFLDDLLADAATAARALAAKKEVTIQIGDFEEAPVQGDPVLLRQLLLIFLDNAIKFSPRGGVVEGSVSARAGRAVATIRDSGPGIPKDELPRIFERFYRAAPAKNGDGSGIGLSIAAVIADAHDAVIGIDSEVGHGTTIRVELPLAATVMENPQVVPTPT
jgi:signal transduction histidine kinase